MKSKHIINIFIIFLHTYTYFSNYKNHKFNIKEIFWPLFLTFVAWQLNTQNFAARTNKKKKDIIIINPYNF